MSKINFVLKNLCKRNKKNYPNTFTFHNSTDQRASCNKHFFLISEIYNGKMKYDDHFCFVKKKIMIDEKENLTENHLRYCYNQ